MRTRVVIQSRLSSSRLPGKALMTVAGFPLIELVARRAARTGFEVVVATSVEPYDDLIADHLARVGIRVVRGPLDDVLQRFVDATSDLDDSDRVVRLTGDNPVGDADLVQELIDAMAHDGHIYGRVDIEQVPEGLGVEVFTAEVLRRAGREAVDAYDREHVTPWIRRQAGELLFAPAANPGDPAAYRCTTDCLHDYDRVARLFSGVADPVSVSWVDIVEALKAQVDGLGPRPSLRPGGRGFAEVMLSAELVGVEDGVRDLAVARDMFAHALDRGVGHVYCRAQDVATVRATTLPALNRRLQHVVQIDAPQPGPAAAAELAAAVERAFADLGERRLAGVVLAGEVPADCWSVLQAYAASGVIGEIGLRTVDTTTLPSAATMVVLGAGAAGDVEALLASGRLVVIEGSAAAPAGVIRLVAPASAAELTEALGR